MKVESYTFIRWNKNLLIISSVSFCPCAPNKSVFLLGAETLNKGVYRGAYAPYYPLLYTLHASVNDIIIAENKRLWTLVKVVVYLECEIKDQVEHTFSSK